MADTKITSLLTPQVTTNPATDVLPIVNIADTSMASSGSTRKITVNSLLGAGGTATLASATISGALTVDTTTLVVNPSGYADRVGIGTATPAAELHVIGGANFSDGTTTLRAVSSGNVAFLGTITTDPLVLRVNNIEQYRIAQLGVFTWSDGAGGTRMTLNSNGLGVGTASHSTKLGVVDTVNTFAATFRGNLGTDFVAIGTTSLGASINAYTAGFGAASNLILQPNGGNVGIGVTPSAWASGYKAIQGQIGGFALSNDNSSNNQFRLSSNAYFDTTDSRWEYYGTSTATAYEQRAGEHRFFNAVSGSANTEITFTQAMTLDASGRLLVGSAASGTSAGDGIVKLGTYGHCISQTGTSIASGSSVDLTIVTSGAGYQGFLSVANTQDASANTRTQTTYSVFGRGASATFTQIATANGSIGGATFTVTTPSNGVIRITNTSGAAATISAQFFGGASA